jgi:hypothetical protein
VSPTPEELKKEPYEAYVARQKEQSEIRRQAGQVAISLDPSPDDKTFTKEYQAELREVLGPLLRDKGLIKPRVVALDSADAVGGYTGEFVIALASVSQIVTHALIAWIQRKPGKGVTVEYYPDGTTKKVQAQTAEQMLSLAKVLDQEARAKVPKAKTK